MARAETVVAVHGGAGGATPSSLSPQRRRAVVSGLVAALLAGRDALLRGGSALDAVLAAVVVLEDAEAFNAGRGAVLRDDGSIAHDASIMWGADRSAGAVAVTRRVRNPIRAAEAVRRDGRHVLLCAEGADAFAAQVGLEPVDPAYFMTSGRAEQLARARAGRELLLDHDERSGGTVGAVARDASGHLAAATSTGGMTNAVGARIGDSPIIGAGTWADDATCAVSATGMGETFLRSAFAHEIDAGLRLAGYDLADACAYALERASTVGGRGGCIALDARGRVELPFNTSAMPRGHVRGDGRPLVALFDEPCGVPEP